MSTSTPQSAPVHIRMDLLWALLIGCAGALVAYGFRRGTELLQWVLTGHHLSLTETAAALPGWARVAVPVLGGLIAGVVLVWGRWLYRGRPETDYIDAIRAGDGTITVRPSLIRSLSSMFTIASGGSIGREGPLVQLSALVGSLPGRWTMMESDRKRLLTACGAAAGIASAYNAPIAGALFVAEIVLGSISNARLAPLMISSMAATVITRDLLDEQPIYSAHALGVVWRGEFLGYIALGILAGLVAPLFLLIIERSRRLFNRFGQQRYLALALGGAIVGLISLYEPRIWGNGYGIVNSMLNDQWLPRALVAILVLKVIATAATVGSGAIGGVFTPTLFVGAAVGELFGWASSHLFSGRVESPAAYGLAGMAALLAGTTHAPMMSLLMVFEMSLDYRLVLPLMLSSVVAYYVSAAFTATPVYGRPDTVPEKPIVTHTPPAAAAQGTLGEPKPF